MKIRIIVSGIVTNGEYVLLGKKDRPPYQDCWHTIGGGVKDFSKGLKLLGSEDYDNEYLHGELVRELSEEAPNMAIHPNISCIIPSVRKTPREAKAEGKDGNIVHMIFLEYFCRYKEGDITAADDIVELQWFKKSDLSKVKLTPPSYEMYAELGWL